jgi:uncharacterized protein (DUF427 family)
METVQTKDRSVLRVETGPKRVRAYLGGHVVADTLRPLLVWEVPYYPAYYVPGEDVRATLVPTGGREVVGELGAGVVHDVTVGDGITAPGAALTFPDAPDPAVRGAVRLAWASMDEWLEEDEPVYTHPRDPHTRVDILASSRHVVIEKKGQVVAESRQPRILFETGLPPRYYLPLSDVRLDLLRPSATESHCPYKGTAGYWDLVLGDRVFKDFVWIYRTPLPESQKIAGLACFYNERVDITLDGVRQEPPRSPLS